MLAKRDFHLQTGNLGYKTGLSFTNGESWVTNGILGLLFTKEYADRQDVTEQLKKDNPYEWIGRMNNIQACVREVVGTELIYT